MCEMAQNRLQTTLKKLRLSSEGTYVGTCVFLRRQFEFRPLITTATVVYSSVIKRYSLYTEEGRRTDGMSQFLSKTETSKTGSWPQWNQWRILQLPPLTFTAFYWTTCNCLFFQRFFSLQPALEKQSHIMFQNCLLISISVITLHAAIEIPEFVPGPWRPIHHHISPVYKEQKKKKKERTGNWKNVSSASSGIPY